MKTIEARFMGGGNVWLANNTLRGWKIQCSRCDESKIVSSHRGGSIPPKAIINKLRTLGWFVGRRPEDDLCAACQRKREVAAKIDSASKLIQANPTTLREMLVAAQHAIKTQTYSVAAEHIASALRRYDEAMAKEKAKSALSGMNGTRLRDLAGTEEMTNKIETISPKKPEPQKEPPKDDDYDKWLIEQQVEHDRRKRADD